MADRPTSKIHPRESPWHWIVTALALGLSGGGGLGTWVGGQGYSEIQATQAKILEAVEKLDETVEKMDRRIERVEARDEQTWTQSQMDSWSKQLQINNRELKVPGVK